MAPSRVGDLWIYDASIHSALSVCSLVKTGVPSQPSVLVQTVSEVKQNIFQPRIRDQMKPKGGFRGWELLCKWIDKSTGRVVKEKVADNMRKSGVVHGI